MKSENLHEFGCGFLLCDVLPVSWCGFRTGMAVFAGMFVERNRLSFSILVNSALLICLLGFGKLLRIRKECFMVICGEDDC